MAAASAAVNRKLGPKPEQGEDEMDAKHTPGPWYSEHVNGGVQLRGTGMTVFTIDAGALPIPADARLIAAAPELLEALKSAVFALESSGYNFESCAATGLNVPLGEQIHRAIAKATTE